VGPLTASEGRPERRRKPPSGKKLCTLAWLLSTESSSAPRRIEFLPQASAWSKRVATDSSWPTSPEFDGLNHSVRRYVPSEGKAVSSRLSQVRRVRTPLSLHEAVGLSGGAPNSGFGWRARD